MSHSRKSLVELVETSLHPREFVGFDKLNQRPYVNVTSGLFQVAMAPMIDKAFCTELPKWRMAAAMFSQPS
jgi:hypothetical protein